MNKTITEFFKNPVTQSALVGIFGGIAPQLIKLLPRLLQDNLPHAGEIIAMAILGIFGLATVLIYAEKDGCQSENSENCHCDDLSRMREVILRSEEHTSELQSLTNLACR